MGRSRGALEGTAEAVAVAVAVADARLEEHPTALPKEKMVGNSVGLVKATGVGLVKVV